MRKTVKDFAASAGLALTDTQLDQLEKYVSLVWQKKDFLNLTSAADTDEIFTRHICDGLAGAAEISARARARGLETFRAADAGAGAGYIGIVCAAALPQAQVTLIESLEKRCKFMQWAVFQLGLKNVSVQNARLGMGMRFEFDFMTERAMGKLADILDVCLGALKPGGTFLAYQSGREEAEQSAVPPAYGAFLGCKAYRLPREEKTRYLAVFAKK